MKVITFFNEKGGSAKSTFATLFASWLQYELGIKTALVDIDNRIARDRVMQLMMRPECEGREFWDIFDVNQNYLKKINEKSHIRIDSYAEWFKAFNRNGKFKKYEVIVIDFPGNMEDFLEFYKKDLLSLIVIPVERDTHTMSTTIRLSRFLKNKDVPYIGFINKAQSFQNMVLYDEMKNIQMKYGLKMLPDVVSFSERVNKSVTKDTPSETVIRSTLTYPDWENDAFKGAGDLGIDNLMIDITNELIKSKDIANTIPAPLSFDKILEKRFHPRRQLRNTSFPEYEFDETCF